MNKITDTITLLCAQASLDAYDNYTVDSHKTDTQVLIRKYSGFVIVAFRGTSSWKDFKQDLKRIQHKTKKGDIHSGFRQCCMDVFNDLHTIITKFDVPIIFTGHSLGGAIAQVMATITHLECSCVTFGAPRVGDQNFCKYLEFSTEGRLALYEHYMDRVTWVPFFGYTKPKKFIKKKWNWSLLSTSAHSMDNYLMLVQNEIKTKRGINEKRNG